MEYGIFLPIANNGWIVSRNAPQYRPTFDLNKNVAALSERAGYDFVFSMTKLRGFGGETQHWDYALDSLTLSAGLAAATSRIKIFGSVSPLALHPAIAARAGSTVDEISGGRFGLNLVAGWHKSEYSQMGTWPEDHLSTRYERADEWLKVVEQLWTQERVTFKGKYYSLDDCVVWPRPVQQPRPPIVCAGMSSRGIEFTADHGDYSFLASSDPQRLRELGEDVRSAAARRGRRIKTLIVINVVLGDTDAEAHARAEWLQRGADAEALAHHHASAGGSASAGPAEAKKRMAEKEQSVFLVPNMSGSAHTLADEIGELLEVSQVDGVMFTVPDFNADLERFSKDVFPNLPGTVS